MTPLLIGGRVVALGQYAQIRDLCARLRARGISATVPATCDGCGRRRRSVRDYYELAVCVTCRRRLARGERLAIDYEREAERRSGAEPE